MTNQTALSPATGTERVYALDALRGIMMLLGIFLHAACTYCIADLKEGWPLKAPQTNFVFDVLLVYIHAFRMPVFYITSGFFAALLMQKRGARGMISNRFRRLVLPFLAGVFLLCPLTNAAFAYSRLAFKGGHLTTANVSSILTGSYPFPSIIHHLWFLYWLIIYVFAIALLSLLFQKQSNFIAKCSYATRQLIRNFWFRFLFMTVLLFLFLYGTQDPIVEHTETWIPYLPSLLLYFFYFLFGWGVFKTGCLASLKQYPALQTVIGSLLVLVFAYAPWPFDKPWVPFALQALSAIFSTLLINGIIALFLTRFNRFSARLTYLMDAAYWVYLIHYPIVILIPGFIAGSHLPLIAAFLIVLFITTAFCFLSYQFFVRASFIGMFLNGKVHRRKGV